MKLTKKQLKKLVENVINEADDYPYQGPDVDVHFNSAISHLDAVLDAIKLACQNLDDSQDDVYSQLLRCSKRIRDEKTGLENIAKTLTRVKLRPLKKI